MKTGILGGTFNPIHLAHLRIAEEVEQACQLDRLMFIPAAEPPHKDVDGQVSFAHRLAMVKAAIRDCPKFQASDLEIRRTGKSFSVDTLEILRKDDSQGELYFIIGLDSYRDIASWKDFTRIFSLCHLVVMTRPGVDINDPLAPLPVAVHQDFCYDKTAARMQHKSGNSVIFLKETCLDISSTKIRSMLADGQTVDHLITPAVANYINQHGLYQVPTA